MAKWCIRNNFKNCFNTCNSCYNDFVVEIDQQTWRCSAVTWGWDSFTNYGGKVEQTSAFADYTKSRNDIYPTYDKVLKAKSSYYPFVKSRIITEYSTKTRLQELFDYTVQLLLDVQKSVIQIQETEVVENLTLLFKWSCDGSIGHFQYKQQYGLSGCAKQIVICL